MTNNVVLLVEDNTDDVDLTIFALKKNKVLVDLVVMRDGVEALEYLFGTGPHAGRDMSVMPIIILLDLKLPKVDGLEVLRRLRADERTKHLPVVILTTSREQHDVLRCYSLGANSYIRKPVDFDQFVEVLKKLVDYWLVLNVLPVAERGNK